MPIDEPEMNQNHARTSRLSVVERMTQVMETFTLGGEHLLLEDVAALTGLPRSTAFRILSQLTALDWLEHGPRGFRLGVRSLGLASHTRTEHDDIRIAASPALNHLHAVTGAVAHLGVLEYARVHYLDKIGGAAAGTVPSRIGGRLPAEDMVCGKALLSCIAPEQVDALLTVSSARRRRALDLPRLHDQLNNIRRTGLAYDSADHCPLGITAVAAPVMGPDGAVGAISIAARKPLPLERVAPMLAQAARLTAEALYPGWKPRARQHQPRRAYA